MTLPGNSTPWKVVHVVIVHSCPILEGHFGLVIFVRIYIKLKLTLIRLIMRDSR